MDLEGIVVVGGAVQQIVGVVRSSGAAESNAEQGRRCIGVQSCDVVCEQRSMEEEGRNSYARSNHSEAH